MDEVKQPARGHGEGRDAVLRTVEEAFEPRIANEAPQAGLHLCWGGGGSVGRAGAGGPQQAGV